MIAGGLAARITALAMVLAVSAAIRPVEAQMLPMIEYGYPEQPPRAYTNANGEPDGHYPRLLNVLFSKVGMSWRGSSLPAPRLMHSLQSGETNFSILVPNPLLDQCCIYSRRNVWYDELRVYSIGDKPLIRTKEDLAGKSIITLSGFSYGGLATILADPKNAITNNVAHTHEAAFAMLEAGRADYLLNYAEVADAHVLSRRSIPELRQSVLDTVRMYFVISRSYPDAQKVLDRLEAVHGEIRANDIARQFTK
ncbi:ABC-type amino acid transport/signal transduction system protein [Candidatus Terasakiella magnetica]|nr:ABC-type amino acid transport/signal transduction system protein [Candidatus Terasakiella magnetica]